MIVYTIIIVIVFLILFDISLLFVIIILPVGNLVERIAKQQFLKVHKPGI